jgi:hypothetical protein
MPTLTCQIVSDTSVRVAYEVDLLIKMLLLKYAIARIGRDQNLWAERWLELGEPSKKPRSLNRGGAMIKSYLETGPNDQRKKEEFSVNKVWLYVPNINCLC